MRRMEIITTVAALMLLASPTLVSAHEHRHVGEYEMVVGWGDEPTFVGFKNAVQLILHDHQGKPVTDLGEDLKVEVIFGNQKMGPLALERAFGKTYGTPGDYRAPIIPTRPGNYTFHFIGSIKDVKVDQSFTSSDKTFDPAADASQIEFPAKDPSRAELAVRLERLSPRIDRLDQEAGAGRTAAQQASNLAVAGIALGAAGLIVGLMGWRRRAK